MVSDLTQLIKLLPLEEGLDMSDVGAGNDGVSKREIPGLSDVAEADITIAFPYGFCLMEVEGEQRITGMTIDHYRQHLAEEQGVPLDEIAPYPEPLCQAVKRGRFMWCDELACTRECVLMEDPIHSCYYCLCLT